MGSFEASFVPTRRDFSRLDQRFRLPDDVWQALLGYDDWGFAVFKLGPMSRLTGVHPMALGQVPATLDNRGADALDGERIGKISGMVR